jgi:CubicO group peptidase (beta-lactamase class C family)
MASHRAVHLRSLGLIFGLCLAATRLMAAEFEPDKLEQLAIQEMKATNTPGAAIAVVRDGNVAWSKGLGFASIETRQPVSPQMLFRLGSTTKMFTAAALLSFVEQGKLRLDEPIGIYLKGLDPQIAALTPHQLLTHTAGLTDESVMDGPHDDLALAAGVRDMNASWLFTKPGKIYSYANPGYWIAGCACEELSGKAYADLMNERLFNPLGMSRTTLRPMVAMTWPLALGHEVRGGEPVVIRPQADNASTRPAGQMYSSVLDLARFTAVLMDEGRLEGKQVLPLSLITRLTTPYVARPGDGGHYGYGLGISQERGVRLWQHAGSRSGYGSTIRMAPDHKTAVIIITNRSGSSLPRTANSAQEMLLPFSSPPEMRTITSQSLNEKEMAELAGRYTNNRQTIELAIQGSELVAVRSGDEAKMSSRVVRRIAEDQFQIVTSMESGGDGRPDGQYVVVRDSDGRPEYLCANGRALMRQAHLPDK